MSPMSQVLQPQDNSNLVDDTMLALALNGIKSARGAKGSKAAQEIQYTVVRELGVEDLDLILNPPPVNSAQPQILKIRNTHHTLARLMAQGIDGVEISAITGISASRQSILKNDPAFKELLHYYASQVEAKFLDVHERLAALGTDAVETLHDRLEESPDNFTNKQLMELVELTLDRSVAPKKSTAGNNANIASAPPVINIAFVAPPQLPSPALSPQITLDIEPQP